MNILDYRINTLAREIVRCAYYSEVDYHAILNSLNNFNNYNLLVVELEEEEKQEQLLRVRKKEEYDNEIINCAKCNKQLKRKELIYIGFGDGLPYKFSGAYCQECIIFIREEYQRQYYRECILCKNTFYAYNGSLCDDCKKYSIELQRVRSNNLRTETLKLPSNLTLQEWLEIIEKYNKMCAYCNKREFTEMDHVIPVSKGGGTTKDNVLPTCKVCNISKKDKNKDEWLFNELNQIIMF